MKCEGLRLFSVITPRSEDSNEVFDTSSDTTMGVPTDSRFPGGVRCRPGCRRTGRPRGREPDHGRVGHGVASRLTNGSATRRRAGALRRSSRTRFASTLDGRREACPPPGLPSARPVHRWPRWPSATLGGPSAAPGGPYAGRRSSETIFANATFSRTSSISTVTSSPGSASGTITT